VVVSYLSTTSLKRSEAASHKRTTLIETADFHFLARKMVTDKVDLQAGISGIARIGIAPLHLAQRRQSLLGNLLVAGYVADLLIIAFRAIR
jgi:hypothetical protein